MQFYLTQRTVREANSGDSLQLAPSVLDELSGGLKGQCFLLDGFGEVHKNKVVFVIEVVLATLVNDSNEVILSCSRIWENPIDFAEDKRHLVVGIIDAESEGLSWLFHHSYREEVRLDEILCAWQSAPVSPEAALWVPR